MIYRSIFVLLVTVFANAYADIENCIRYPYVLNDFPDLKIGLTKEEVERLTGPPLSKQYLPSEGGELVSYFFYNFGYVEFADDFIVSIVIKNPDFKVGEYYVGLGKSEINVDHGWYNNGLIMTYCNDSSSGGEIKYLSLDIPGKEIVQIRIWTRYR